MLYSIVKFIGTAPEIFHYCLLSPTLSTFHEDALNQTVFSQAKAPLLIPSKTHKKMLENTKEYIEYYTLKMLNNILAPLMPPT